VSETRRATHELSLGGELEALGDGFFGLLHGESGRKQRSPGRLARGNCEGNAPSTPEVEAPAL
jgi:hypothetical protein